MEPTTHPEDAPAEGSVSQILKEFGVLNKEDTESSPEQRLLHVVTQAARAGELVERLFPSGVPTDASFFDRLRDLRRWVSYGQVADDAIGHLWVAALQRISQKQQLNLLGSFAEETGHDLFTNLDCLHVVVGSIFLPVDFVADWFTKLCARIEGDLAQGGFWNAVRAFCKEHRDSAIELLGLLVQDLVGQRLQIATVIVGVLRGQTLNAKQRSEYERIESHLRDHPNPTHRSCFNWSWTTTACDYGISSEQLQSLITRAEVGDCQDAESILGACCRMLQSDKIDRAVFEKAFNWISERVSPDIARETKLHVADVATMLQRSPDEADKSRLDCSGWMIAIQPVAQEDAGTWGRIEAYLVEMLNSDPSQFADVFLGMADRCAADLLAVMRKPQAFDWLLRELESEDLGEMVGCLIMSRDTSTRRLGLHLFGELAIEAIPEAAFTRNGDLGVRLLFYEMQRNLLRAESIARIFISLIPRVETMDEPFQEEVKAELQLQARNFAGGCRAELQRLGGEFALVQEVVDEMTTYFEDLKRARESKINAMEVPSARRARAIQRRRMARQISASAEQHSVMLQLFKKVRLLYGRESSAYIGGNLQDASPLSEISSGFEIPFVDYCDPEYMAIRRINASSSIEALLNQSGESTDDEP